MVVDVIMLNEMADWAEYQEALPMGEREWDQGTWGENAGEYCGTAYCVAGYVVSARPDFKKFGPDGYFESKTGTQHWIDRTAQNMLGIEDEDADVLFSGDNSAEDIRYWVNQILWRD